MEYAEFRAMNSAIVLAQTGYLSVTVIARDATTAEVFAKALLIAGSAEAASLAAHRGDITYLAVDTNGNLSGTYGLAIGGSPSSPTLLPGKEKGANPLASKGERVGDEGDSSLWSAKLIYGATTLVVAALSVHYFATKYAHKRARAA